MAEWNITSPRVEIVLECRVPPRHEVLGRIPVPVEIEELRKSDPKRAREIQLSVGEQFQLHFEKGHAVVGFEKSEQAGTYLLGPWESK